MSTAAANEEQAIYWSEAGGRSWVEYQAQMDRQLQPLGDAALAALAPQPGESVLDVGCGCGATTVALASAVGPTGRVVGVDISTSMTAVADSTLQKHGFSHAQAVVLDAQTASPADLGGHFDAVFSRFGVMFFADPIAAFRNIRALTNEDGRLAFVCWQSPRANPWMSNLGLALGELLPPGPPADLFAPGPFAFADPGRTADLLSTAGWAEVAVEPCVRPMLLFGTTDFEDALNGSLKIGAASRLLQGADEALIAKVREVARAVLSEQWTPHGAVMDGVCWLVTAKNVSPEQG